MGRKGINRVNQLAITAIILIAAVPARAAPEVGLTINQVKSGTLLFHSQTPGRYIPAPLVAADIDIRIAGPVARVRVRQSFLNPSKSWLEARYVFPLPEDAAIDHMRLKSGDTVITADIKERQKARRIYNRAKRTGRRAALIEQQRPNIFNTRVANIAPLATTEIEISYLQRIRYDQGRFSIRFPMVVAPRYTPPSGKQIVSGKLPSSPTGKPEETKTNPVRLTIHLDAGVALSALSSPYHQITAEGWEDGAVTIQLADKIVPADRDFELVWTPKQTGKPLTSFFSEIVDGDRFVMAMILPPGGKAIAPPPRDVVFVLDRSGSMSGPSIRQARKALIFALDRLRPSDRFEIIRFSNETDSLFGGVRPANTISLDEAKRFVAGTKAGGGTEMRPALALALAAHAPEGRIRQIVFITDGAIGNEAELLSEVSQKIGTSRLFTIGIGSAPNSYFMRRAAAAGRGSFTFIGKTTQVAEKMRALLLKIERPVMVDLTAAWSGMKDGATITAYPGGLSDLHDGEPVVLIARLSGPEASIENGTLTLGGRRGQQIWRRKLTLATAGGGTGIGTLWGRERIQFLMDSMRNVADRQSVRDAVIATALKHNIVSRYTSLVATEKKSARPKDEPLYPRDVPRNLPHGWEFENLLKKPTSARAAASPAGFKARATFTDRALQIASAAPVQLPAGGTDGPIQLIIGALALGLAAGGGAWLRRSRR